MTRICTFAFHFVYWLCGTVICAGLAAYIFTRSMPRSWRVSEALEYGLVGVNEGLMSTEVGSISLSILLDEQNKFDT